MHRCDKRVLLFGVAALVVGCASNSEQLDGSTDTAAIDNGNIQGEGNAVGQIAKNWTLKDHDGKSVSLYDFRGKVIYFESGSEW